LPEVWPPRTPPKARKSHSGGDTRLQGREAHREIDWDPEWFSDRFICLLVCQNRDCQEVCAVTGVTSYDTYQDEEGWDLNRYLEPYFIEPAPEIFSIPKRCPKQVAAELRAAFSLFWSNPSAAMNRVRAGIEALLDAEKVPKKGKTKKGKFRSLTLHQRIQRFLSKDDPTDFIYLGTDPPVDAAGTQRLLRGPYSAIWCPPMRLLIEPSAGDRIWLVWRAVPAARPIVLGGGRVLVTGNSRALWRNSTLPGVSQAARSLGYRGPTNMAFLHLTVAEGPEGQPPVDLDAISPGLNFATPQQVQLLNQLLQI
jgi:hypothetical protein